jgi:hypothetical protein
MPSSRRVHPWILAAVIGGVLLVVAAVASAGAVFRRLTARRSARDSVWRP